MYIWGSKIINKLFLEIIVNELISKLPFYTCYPLATIDILNNKYNNNSYKEKSTKGYSNSKMIVLNQPIEGGGTFEQ